MYYTECKLKNENGGGLGTRLGLSNMQMSLDLLNVLLLEPGGSTFLKKKNDHVIELIYMRTRFVTNGSFVAQRGSCFRLHCAIRVQNH